jgi:hypothetical protein
MAAYFLITFTEWCWVWMDGIWSKLTIHAWTFAIFARS